MEEINEQITEEERMAEEKRMAIVAKKLCKVVEFEGDLKFELVTIREALETAIKMLHHYGPPRPKHICTPDGNCDTICMNYASFEMQIFDFEKLLGGEQSNGQ